MDALEIVTSILSWLILLVSLVGNIALIVSLIKNFKLSSRGYICLMFNLAISDLLTVLTSIPVNFVELLTKPVFPFGAVLCKILWPLQTSIVITAIFTVATVSVQRYLMIVRTSVGFQTCSVPAIVAILFSIWLVPVLVAAVPLSRSLELSSEHECRETWSAKYSKCFTLYLTFIQYILPLAIIAWCNGRAVAEIKKHEVYRENFAIIDSTALRRHKNVVRMLLCIVAVFAILWFPGQLAWLVLTFSEASGKWSGILDVSQLFVFTNAALNPLIFFIYNDDYSINGITRFLKGARNISFFRYIQSAQTHEEISND